MPRLAHQLDDRPVDRVGDLVDALGVEPRHRRVAAHAAGVRALVAVADPLVVLRRREREDVLAVAEREQRELLALQELLEHHLGRPEAPLGEERLDGLARLGLRLADDHALARPPGRRPSGPPGSSRRSGGQAPSRGCAPRRATPWPRRPRPSAPWRRPSSPRSARPPRWARRRRRPPPRARRRARHERRLRADDDEVHGLRDCRVDEARDVLCTDVQAASVGGDPGVAGGREELSGARS